MAAIHAIHADWRPIPLEARPAGGNVAKQEAPVGVPFDVCGKGGWNANLCDYCCCCGPGCCSQQWCCACCCPLLTFGAALKGAPLDYCNCFVGWKACGRGPWSFCCIFGLINCIPAAAAGVVSYYGIPLCCAPTVAMYLGSVINAIACLPSGCYASWLRNQFRIENGLSHNGDAGFWPRACFGSRTSVYDTLCLGSGCCWPCLAYQTVRQVPEQQ